LSEWDQIRHRMQPHNCYSAVVVLMKLLALASCTLLKSFKEL